MTDSLDSRIDAARDRVCATHATYDVLKCITPAGLDAFARYAAALVDLAKLLAERDAKETPENASAPANATPDQIADKLYTLDELREAVYGAVEEERAWADDWIAGAMHTSLYTLNEFRSVVDERRREKP